MCRIAGIIDPSLTVAELNLSINRMCEVLKHGGPDGEGSFISEFHHLALGHRRLALLDLSEAGHQPMEYDEGNYQITYNGEIYNYPELKSELQQLGYTFHTVCDTEMILVAYKAWGTGAFKRFNGMFAFCLFDKAQNLVHLVRDASGIKPLYYYTNKKSLYFSSEVRALKIFSKINKVEKKAKILFLAYGHLPEPITTLENVLMLPKGNFLTFNIETGHHSFHLFKQYAFTEDIKNKHIAIKKIHTQLTEAVKKHLLSDAPIGVFLSGGIDSSLIALLAHKFTGERLKTLSLYFNESQFSEKEFQDLIINTANCDHAQFLLSGDEFSSNLKQVIDDMDLPSNDGINTWFISKYAKAFGLKAVLSGVGSDEMYGGYPSFRRMKTLSRLKKVPPVIRNNIFKILGKKYQRFDFLNIQGIAGEYLFLRGFYTPQKIAELLKITEKDVVEVLNQTPLIPDLNYMTEQNKASWMEMNLYMQNQLLRDSDVMSMAHGIEIRVPFLDTKLISESLSISSKIKYSGQYPKQILIDSFRSVLPEKIWKRKKMGFTFPFKEWLKDNDLIAETMNSNRTYKILYDQFKAGKVTWSLIMALVVMEIKFNE